jgi:hypothetical protein
MCLCATYKKNVKIFSAKHKRKIYGNFKIGSLRQASNARAEERCVLLNGAP